MVMIAKWVKEGGMLARIRLRRRRGGMAEEQKEYISNKLQEAIIYGRERIPFKCETSSLDKQKSKAGTDQR